MTGNEKKMSNINKKKVMNNYLVKKYIYKKKIFREYKVKTRNNKKTNEREIG
jgi:hypothetical protein